MPIPVSSAALRLCGTTRRSSSFDRLYIACPLLSNVVCSHMIVFMKPFLQCPFDIFATVHSIRAIMNYKCLETMAAYSRSSSVEASVMMGIVQVKNWNDCAKKVFVPPEDSISSPPS
jgi:hypothetical protein